MKKLLISLLLICAVAKAQVFQFGSQLRWAAAAAGGCSASASDNFNRANETPLSGGGNWTQVSGEPGTMNLSANTVVYNAIASSSAYYYIGSQTWNGNGCSQTSQLDVSGANTSAGSGYGPIVRAQTGARTYYEAIVNDASGGTVRLGERSAGTFTQITSVSVTFVSGATLKLNVTGSGSTAGITLTATYNGTVVATGHPVALVLNSGNPGIRYSSTESTGSAFGDNWVGSEP